MPNVTYTQDELLATRFSSTAVITKFNFDALVAVLNDDLAVWNAEQAEMESLFCDTTNLQLTNAGSSDHSGDTEALGEIGKASSGTILPGQTFGAPLRRFGKGKNWTRFWASGATPADLLLAQRDIEIMFAQRTIAEIRKGLYNSANYTFTDRFLGQQRYAIDIPVKAFYNSDATWSIPQLPSGKAATLPHNHFLATAALAASDVDSLVNHCAEHNSNMSGLEIHLSLADKAAFTALAGFQKGMAGVYGQMDTTTNSLSRRLSPTDPMWDQWIGVWDSGSSPVANVFIKPWATDNYILCIDTASPAKPLIHRIHLDPQFAGLRLWGRTSDESIFNDQYELLTGYAANGAGRGAAGVLYTGGAVYLNPYAADPATLEK